MAATSLPTNAATSAATASPRLMCVPLTVFRLHQAREVDLYIWPEGDEEPTLYCSSEVALTEADLDRLMQRGFRSLYVTRNAYVELSDKLNSELDGILSNEDVSAEERLAVLQTALALEIDAAFQMVNCDRFVSLSHTVARQINELIIGQAVLPRKLFEIMRHDFFTFTHVTNVASFVTLLAHELGVTDCAELEKITVGGLLHDIGKRFVPPSVLCKPGKLNEQEWRLIKAHPQRGYEDLCDREDITFGQLMMVYSHHERIDGKGYPVGLMGEEIHDWAKMLAVVDVFEALTGARPYRPALKPADALEYLEKNSGTQFDSEMARCWISAMRQR
jgi:HD-GYP domain-containing protein (c-di-GMP phosphodiesterase class II)